ncbi:putative bifunctional diguanylate cyclase/phosphodiesterase [Thermostichus vulcanus]|uniref:EAL domain-containing protein n=1 Tax=Thermostichus vulcanus str. 'Rupite' TaxID=2813851 RepID=A0ABT0CBW4_THEVL|nr:EAL domain-containing protein [Thermostichus vulcanus str. 'Rupite']
MLRATTGSVKLAQAMKAGSLAGFRGVWVGWGLGLLGYGILAVLSQRYLDQLETAQARQALQQILWQVAVDSLPEPAPRLSPRPEAAQPSPSSRDLPTRIIDHLLALRDPLSTEPEPADLTTAVQIYPLRDLDPQHPDRIARLRQLSPTQDIESVAGIPIAVERLDAQTLASFVLLQRDPTAEDQVDPAPIHEWVVQLNSPQPLPYLPWAWGGVGVLLVAGGWLSQADLQRISKQEERYRSILAKALPTVMLVDPATQHILEVNPAFESLLGYSLAEAASLTLKDLVVTNLESLDDARHTEIQGHLLQTPEGVTEQQYWRQDGTTVDVSVSTSTLVLSKRSLLCLIVQEISERKRLEAQLRRAASLDPLTQLPNQPSFIAKLKQAIQRMEEQQALLAVLFLDLDGFKVINDSLGHSVGDHLLVEISQRLSGCLDSSETLARFGGDEFTILLEYVQGVEDALHVAQRVLAAFANPFDVKGQPVPVHLSTSIGIAISQEFHEWGHSGQATSPEELIRNADTALSWAKSRGKAQYAVYDEVMRQRALQRLQMETEIRQALRQEQFRVYYQPIVQLSTGRVVGFEALLRWEHPERGLVSPAEFIPIAEETGLIVQLDRWILQEAYWQNVRWLAQMGKKAAVTLSVNLSGKQFSQPGLVEFIARLLSNTDLDPSYLKLEITESLITESDGEAVEQLVQLRKLGVLISIDDFGTGYSSLSRLHDYPIDTLKIDRSFISRIGPNGENAETIRMIITFAHSLGMDVIAEGIETLQQLHLIKLLNCEYGQGYFFAKPLKPADAEHLLRTQLG